MLQKAGRARYSSWSLRQTTPETRDRHFRQVGNEFLLDEGIRRVVSFESRNLVDDDPGFWQPNRFDVIYCRNVLMYMTPLMAQSVVDRLAYALAPGGYLFLGHAETLRGLTKAFHLCHTHDTFYYQRRAETRSDRQPEPHDASVSAAATSTTPQEFGDVTWMDAIRKASERIAHLTEGARPPSPSTSRSLDEARGEVSAVSWNHGQAIELLKQERYAEALELVRAQPDEWAPDTDAQMLHALLLTNTGRREEAERICRVVLEQDELNAGAHYLMALCREQAGDRRGAIEHNQEAIYLDPSFAMPRLHLAMLAKRARDLETTQRELRRALELLSSEDAARLLLFGGGFSRETLLQFCRGELRICGGAA
jgi:chemotaxis protein methyltransferase CheR